MIFNTISFITPQSSASGEMRSEKSLNGYPEGFSKHVPSAEIEFDFASDQGEVVHETLGSQNKDDAECSGSSLRSGAMSGESVPMESLEAQLEELVPIRIRTSKNGELSGTSNEDGLVVSSSSGINSRSPQTRNLQKEFEGILNNHPSGRTIAPAISQFTTEDYDEKIVAEIRGSRVEFHPFRLQDKSLKTSTPLLCDSAGAADKRQNAVLSDMEAQYARFSSTTQELSEIKKATIGSGKGKEHVSESPFAVSDTRGSIKLKMESSGLIDFDADETLRASVSQLDREEALIHPRAFGLASRYPEKQGGTLGLIPSSGSKAENAAKPNVSQGAIEVTVTAQDEGQDIQFVSQSRESTDLLIKHQSDLRHLLKRIGVDAYSLSFNLSNADQQAPEREHNDSQHPDSDISKALVAPEPAMEMTSIDGLDIRI